MSEKLDFLQISPETKSAKKKLFLFSSIIIFIGYFEPTLSGFLSSFSIQINDNLNHFSIFLVLILIWLSLRYLMLLYGETMYLDSIRTSEYGTQPDNSLSFLSKVGKIFYLAPSIQKVEIEIENTQMTIDEFSKQITEKEVDGTPLKKSDIESREKTLQKLKLDLPELKKYRLNAYILILNEVLLPLVIAITALYFIVLYQGIITEFIIPKQ